MNTKQFYKLISNALGKVDHHLHCSQCKVNKTLYMCGGCFAVSFCGEECQKASWTQSHHEECMYIQGKTRGREGLEEDEEMMPNRDAKRVQYIDLGDIRFRNILEILRRYLNTEDIRNASAVNRSFHRALRRTMFQMQTYKIEPQMLQDEFFKSIAPNIQNVYISNNMQAADVAELSEMALGIKKMIFDDDFDQSVTGILPPALTHLTFGQHFNQDVTGAFPPTLTHLIFDDDFNQDIRGALVSSLKELTLGTSFNHSLQGALHEGLTHLIIGHDFNQDLRESLPSTLTHLTLGHSFNQDVRDTFPRGLEHLVFGTAFNQELHKSLLATSLTFLMFGLRFNQEVRGKLPNTLKHLAFGVRFNQDIVGALPRSLETLRLGYEFNQNVSGAFFETSLTGLFFGKHFNQDIRGTLPPTLRFLKLGQRFNQPLLNALPENLIQLQLGETRGSDYNNIVEGVLPQRLSFLYVSLNVDVDQWSKEAARVGAKMKFI